MPSLSLAHALRSGGNLLKHLASVAPREPKFTVGLDIGSTAIKAVVLGPRRALGSRALLGQRLEPLSEDSDAQVSVAVKNAVSALGLPVKAVNLSVSGQWVVMRVVEMPALKPEELSQALPFEAQRYLPFSLQDVVIDGAVLGPAEANKAWVLIVACKRELLERRVNWVKHADLEPALVDVDALAVANAFLEQSNGEQTAGTYALVNVGAQWVNLVVLKGPVPYLIRDIPWGADKLVRHMAEQVGMEEAAVASQVKQDAPLSPELQQAMKVSCESLTVELQLSFDFFESRFGPPPSQLIVSGGVLQVPGFLDALKSHMTHPLTPWAPGVGLSSRFAVAYGLALRI